MVTANVGDNVRQLLAAATIGLDSRHEAEILLRHVLDCSRSWLFAHPEAVPEGGQQARFRDLVAQRVRGVPVAYLTGKRGFWSFDLEVGPATLIPRSDTEQLVAEALVRLPSGRHLQVADLGTGSGAIALALASERPDVVVTATDRSLAALAFARRNAHRLGLTNVDWVAGDWLAPLQGRRFSMIVSNPPYIAADDGHLLRGDLRFEPREALAAGPDGLADLRVIVAAASACLLAGGWLLLEHGWDQGSAVRALLAAHDYDEVFTARDSAGHERVSGGRRVE